MLGSHRPWLLSHSRKAGERADHPKHLSTWGESLQTHASNSGSMTMAFARSVQAFAAKRRVTSSWISTRVLLSCPLPLRSKTTSPCLQSLANGRRKL